MTVDAKIDAVVSEFYRETVGPFWPPERRWVDQAYRDLALPMTRPERAVFVIERSWQLEECMSYIETWSAVKRFTVENGASPIADLAAALQDRWGPERQTVRWPITLIAGPVH